MIIPITSSGEPEQPNTAKLALVRLLPHARTPEELSMLKQELDILDKLQENSLPSVGIYGNPKAVDSLFLFNDNDPGVLMEWVPEAIQLDAKNLSQIDFNITKNIIMGFFFNIPVPTTEAGLIGLKQVETQIIQTLAESILNPSSRELFFNKVFQLYENLKKLEPFMGLGYIADLQILLKPNYSANESPFRIIDPLGDNPEAVKSKDTQSLDAQSLEWFSKVISFLHSILENPDKIAEIYNPLESNQTMKRSPSSDLRKLVGKMSLKENHEKNGKAIPPALMK